MMSSNVYRHSAVLLIAVAVVSAFVEWKRTPLGILVGGALGLANHHALAWGVERMLGSPQPSMKLLFFSIFRLLIFFLVIAALLALNLVHILGVLIGFTLVFTVILKEGFLSATKEYPDGRR